MIMPRDTPAEKMQEMAAVHPRLVTREYGSDARGDLPLEPRIENGVKVFNLEVSVIRWHILPNVSVDAFAYNGQIPGPRIRVSQGDHVRIVVHSQLPETTTVHWHGLVLPNKMDGPAFGMSFRMLDSFKELHRTPFGTTQQFLYCLCRLE